MGGLPEKPSKPVFNALLSRINSIYIAWNKHTIDGNYKLPILGYILYLSNEENSDYFTTIYDG